jgi:hypothetical protein
MPFGLEYTGDFSSFSVGALWVAYSFAFFFVFTYLALRGSPNAWKTSFKISIYSLIFNICLVWISFPPVPSAILGICAYLVMSKAITHQNMNDFIVTTFTVFINFAIMMNIPDFLLLFYTIFSMYFFYAKSEAKLRESQLPPAPMQGMPQMPGF